jgi:hypothetical protein
METRIGLMKVKCDTNELSKALCNLHEQAPDIALRLSFGLLDHDLVTEFAKAVTLGIENQFDASHQVLYAEEIEAFVDKCLHEIEKGVYKHAKMIV